MMLTRAALLLVLLSLLVVSGSARDRRPDVCEKCQGTREIAIQRDSTWTTAAKTHEKLHLWCSWCDAMGLYDDKKRDGPCPLDGTFPAPNLPDSGFPSERLASLDTQLKYWWKDHACGRVVFMITPTMVVSSELEPMTNLSLTDLRGYYPERKRAAEQCPGIDPKKDRTISKHERAHMYMQRLIDAYEACNDAVGVETADEEKHYRITVPRIDLLLFNSPGQVTEFSSKHGGAGIYLGNQIAPLGSTGSTSNADDILWAMSIHHLAHHWCDRIYGSPRDREPAGWLFNGMANHVEMVAFGEAKNKCDTEFNKGMQWTTSRWRTRVFKAIDDKEIQLQELLTRSKESMNFIEHCAAWSLIDFLSSYSKPKFTKLIEGLVQQKTIAEALRESHGWTTNLLEVNWIQYVQKNYANEPKPIKIR